MREREDGEVQEARQRASIKWLVAKAYNNSPPRECVDPFYRDYNDVERLKPHLVHALGNPFKLLNRTGEGILSWNGQSL